MLYYRLTFFLLVSAGFHVSVLFPGFLQYEKLSKVPKPVSVTFIASAPEELDQGQGPFFNPEQKSNKTIPPDRSLLSTINNKTTSKQGKLLPTENARAEIRTLSPQNATAPIKEKKSSKRRQSIISENQIYFSEPTRTKSNITPSPREITQKEQPGSRLDNSFQSKSNIFSQRLPHKESLTAAIPKKTGNPLPEYPLIAREKNWQGVVWLLVDVSDRGEVVNLVVEKSCGYRALDRSALQAVRQWQFTPAHNIGVPVKSQVRIPVRFQLEKT